MIRAVSAQNVCRLMLGAAVALTAVAGCRTLGGPRSGAPDRAARPKDAPLLLEDEPLLLLSDDPAPARPGADNSRCHVCHVNFQREDLTLVHARAGMGCADCHGPSDEHIADESWASGGNGTAPDIMFRPAEINPACLECHERNDLDDADHKAFFAGSAAEKVCTDCHGKHRMAKRRCTWK